VQFESLSVDFDPRRLTKEHPFMPEGYLHEYFLFNEPEALHYHDFLEIGYCVSGSGLFYVDGEVIPFSAPCFSIIYGGQVHIAQNVGPQRSLWHFCYINLKKLFTDTELVEVSRLKAMSPHLYDFPTVLSQAADPILHQLVVAALDESATLKGDYLTAMRGLIMALLTRHSRMMTPTKKSAHVHQSSQQQLLSRLGEVLLYINQHYTEDLTIDHLTRASGISKATLQRDMIDFTGLAPMQYIHQLRMKRATLLLAEGIPVADVAFNVGYNTLSSFNRHFLQEFGMSPTRWKRQQQCSKHPDSTDAALP